MTLGGLLPAIWLSFIWAALILQGPASRLALILVLITCVLQPLAIWRVRLFWIGTTALLAVAYCAASLFMGPAKVPLLPYLSVLGIVVAPAAVSGYIDGFWVCAWMARCRCPRGIILALSGALSATPVVVQDTRVLAYQSRRMGMHGFRMYLGLLVASASSLLDRVVDIEIAYEMFDLFSVYHRWEGRRVHPTEWLFALQIALLGLAAVKWF
jgi:hypothetical protein